MTVKTGSAWAGTFVTLDATGALAAGTPAGVLYVDGTANGASVTITGSNPYKFSVTLPALTAGQRVDMYITATIDSISTAGIVASEQADTTILSDGVAVASIANNAITASVIATDAIDADSIKADAIAEIQAGLATPTNITAGTIATVTNLTNLPAMPADWITASGLKADAVAEIADGVWDEAIAGHTTGTTFGGKNQKVVPSETINDYKADVSGLALEATLTAIKGATWTDETLVGLMTAIEGISAGSGASVADILNALLASYTVSGSVGESLGRLDNIQAKTDNLPASPANEATLTAIKGAGWVNESLTGIQTSIDSSVLSNQTIMDGKLDVIDGIVDEILIDTGTTLPAAIIAGSAGSGATAKTYTVTDGSSPISGVHVWITTDLSGTNIIASGYTDDLGEVIFFLDSGTTYYVWRQKSGYTFSNPDTETA